MVQRRKWGPKRVAQVYGGCRKENYHVKMEMFLGNMNYGI